MFVRNLQVALPRRITAYFLLFGLAAIVWLGAGVFYVATAVTQSRSTSGVLSAMGKASHRIALRFLETGQAELQGEIERLQRQDMLAYCALVAPSGEHLAHSTPAEVGQPANEPVGAVESWGDVERVRFINEQGLVIVEYRAPLNAGGRHVGSLRMGVVEPSAWNTLLSAAQYGPLAILGPLLLMGLGAVVVSRLVRPVSDVEQQLRRVAVAATVAECSLEEVEVRGAAALGWNRLVEDRLTGAGGIDLHERLSQSLQGVQHRRLSGILNSLSEGVVTTDREGNITYHNRSVIVLLERRQRAPVSDDEQAEQERSQAPANTEQPGDPAQADVDPAGQTPVTEVSLEGDSLMTWLGRNWQLPPDSPLSDPKSLQRTVVCELERGAGGPRRVLRVTRSPLRSSESGEQDGHVWTLRDVTQQKLAEEMRTQFVDTATHELRTPLANIKAYAETLALQDVVDVEHQKDFLNTINSEATRLARFVDDLLSVSSMEIGSLSLTKLPTDLDRLFKSVMGKVKPQMTEKDITFETHFPEKWPEPELDKEKIAATVVNLLGNAAKYTPRGGRVGLRVKVNEEQLEISVEDTGIGIAQDDIPKLFDKFFRANDPRVHEETGTGLGLSLAHEVVRLHGGKITVDSELNKGSTFLMSLPLK